MTIQTFYSKQEAEAVSDPKTIVSYDGTYVVYSEASIDTPPFNPAEGTVEAVQADPVIQS